MLGHYPISIKEGQSKWKPLDDLGFSVCLCEILSVGLA